MSYRRPLTVSQMLLSLISCESENEFICLWNCFVDLHEHGFISDKQWLSFYHTAQDWYFDPYVGRVLYRRSDSDFF